MHAIFPQISETAARPNNLKSAPPQRYRICRRPVQPAQQLESELWEARLSFCSEWQLDAIPGCADGIPNQFDYHPFRFLDHKEQARIRKQAAARSAQNVSGTGELFYVNFSFLRASTKDFSRPNEDADRVVQSFDGYNSYLLIVDEHSRYVWVFLCKSKDPPIDEMSGFLRIVGPKEGGFIRCDLGGKLANCKEFVTIMQRDHRYSVEPTGADSPSQNGGVERYNNTMAVSVRAILYGASLTAEYWSAAPLHSVYLQNRKVSRVTGRTPYEGWHGYKPNLKGLRLFGSRVCVKRSGDCRAKLDRHDFTGIFHGFTATDNNVQYIDINTGIFKTSHHAVFDEAWYLQDSRPPASQLLYNLALMSEEDLDPFDAPGDVPPAAYPPCPTTYQPLFNVIDPAIQLPIPFRLMAKPPSVAARLANLTKEQRWACVQNPYANTALEGKNRDAIVVEEYFITKRDIAQVYFSPHAYHAGFDIELNLRKFSDYRQQCAGMRFRFDNERLILTNIVPRLPAAKIPRWRSRIRHAWLRKIGDIPVSTVADVKRALLTLSEKPRPTCMLIFSHPEIKHGLSNDGIPQLNVDQLNSRNKFHDFCMPDGALDKSTAAI